jgi:Amt family ammonium transporter
MLAGNFCVAITAPCAFVTAPAAVLIGLIAGLLLCGAVLFVERTLKIDDPVGAVSVHGVNGAWGVFALGLFADGTYGDALNGVEGCVTGLFYGNASQLAAQCIGILANIGYVGLIGYVVFKLMDVTIGLRVDPEQEAEGLDQYEVAVIAYPDFNIRSSSR